MTYREYRPPAGLRACVECLWMIHDTRARAGRPLEHVIPDGCPEIVVHLADPFARQVRGRWRRQPAAFLAGTLSRPWRLRPGRRVLTLGIRLRPGALTRLFDVDMAATTDREWPLARLVGEARAAELRTALARAGTPAQRVAAARRWLLRVAPPTMPPESLAGRACRALLAGRGRPGIAEVAARLDTTSRRLERQFARHVGVRPKLFARIARLQAALALLDQAERGRAAEWALEAGYFDQAHLARDFRVIAGRSALRPRGADGEMARHFTAPARLAALLAGE